MPRQLREKKIQRKKTKEFFAGFKVKGNKSKQPKKRNGKL
jgi:hypothetical protein